MNGGAGDSGHRPAKIRKEGRTKICKAFSGLVKANGDVLWEFGVDSHEDIIKKHGLRDDEADALRRTFARFEIAPDNGSYLAPDKWMFKLDEGQTPTWWSKVHEAEAWKAHKVWLKKLDEILVRKPIVHPFRDIAPPKKIAKKHLALLKQWASIGASIGDSVGASVEASVGASVRASVWDSVEASVGASVRASVWDSVRASIGDSVGASVWASVWDSVRDSVWAYVGSFFNLPREAWTYTENIKCAGYPFQPAVDLWMMGLVPSFDGTTWRLHGHKDGRILWEGKI